MWPVPVVMIDEHLKGPLKVLLVQNQQPVETFRAGRARTQLTQNGTLHRVPIEVYGASRVYNVIRLNAHDVDSS